LQQLQRSLLNHLLGGEACERLKPISALWRHFEALGVPFTVVAMDFELFRPELNPALSYTGRTEGGRPPFDPVLVFKILIIQATNNLPMNAPNFSSMTGCRLCDSWDWASPSVLPYWS
jgi:hypothetical protein